MIITQSLFGERGDLTSPHDFNDLQKGEGQKVALKPKGNFERCPHLPATNNIAMEKASGHVRFGVRCGLMTDIALGPLCANS